MHDLPLLNPVSSWRRIVSVAADILFRIMRLKILHVIDNKVMPRQLLQFPESPFFGSLIIVPVFQSSGVSSSSQIFWKIWHRILGVSCSSAFNISGQSLSLPGVFSILLAFNTICYGKLPFIVKVQKENVITNLWPYERPV